MTKIETGIAQRLAERLSGEIEKEISAHIPSRLSRLRFENTPDLIRLVPLEENLLIAAYEINAPSFGGRLQLVYPREAIAPLLKSLSPGVRTPNPKHPVKSSQSVEQIEIDVHIQLAKGVLPLSQIAQLKGGDTLKLDTDKSDPAVVFLGNKPKFLARPGLHGGTRAVKILKPIPPEDENQYR